MQSFSDVILEHRHFGTMLPKIVLLFIVIYCFILGCWVNLDGLFYLISEFKGQLVNRFV